MDSIEELWFSKASDTMDTRTKGAIIMSVVAPLKERPSPMEETLKHVRSNTSRVTCRVSNVTPCRSTKSTSNRRRCRRCTSAARTLLIH